MFGVMFGYKCLSFDAKSMPERLLGNGIKNTSLQNNVFVFIVFVVFFSAKRLIFAYSFQPN